MKAQYKLKDLLRAINVINVDTDCEVMNYGLISVCPPFKLSEMAKNKFKDILEMPVEGTTIYSEKDDPEADKECFLAWELLTAHAGYVPENILKKWFNGEEL